MFRASQTQFPYQLSVLSSEQKHQLLRQGEDKIKVYHSVSPQAVASILTQLDQNSPWEESEDEEKEEAAQLISAGEKRRASRLKLKLPQQHILFKTVDRPKTSGIGTLSSKEESCQSRRVSSSSSQSMKRREGQKQKQLITSTVCYEPILIKEGHYSSQKLAVDKHTLMDLYTMEVPKDDLESVRYKTETGQDGFFGEVFKMIMSDRASVRLYNLRELQHAKMRTLVVRRALQSFISQQIKQFPEVFQDENQQGLSMYGKIGIEDPPCRMRTNYIRQLFQIEGFVKFYQHYLSSNQLAQFLHETNRDTMYRFMQFLVATSQKTSHIQDKVRAVKKFRRRPLFSAQIDEYLEQANLVLLEFGSAYVKKSVRASRSD